MTLPQPHIAWAGEPDDPYIRLADVLETFALIRPFCAQDGYDPALLDELERWLVQGRTAIADQAA